MMGALVEGVVYLAPFLLLAVALAAGFHPGESLVVALVARPPRRRRPRSSLPPLPRLIARHPRGGRLLATALAGRAPPLGC
jgi:hypothetical protein